jgi:hypothetical protein
MNNKILRVAAGVVCTAMLLGCEKKSDYEICIENVYPGKLRSIETDKYNSYKDYSQKEKENAAKSQASTLCARAMNMR